MKNSCSFIGLMFCLLLISCKEDEVVSPGIIYRNVNEQISEFPDSYSLDIDLDGETDFVFSTRSVINDGFVNQEYNFYPTRSNAVFELAGRVAVLEENQSVEPGNPFSKNTAPMIIRIDENDEIRWEGDWTQVTNKYIGIHFTDFKDVKRYGWIQVSFNVDTETLFIHDLAYQVQGNTGIKAGQK
jgi:hypothetical protein